MIVDGPSILLDKTDAVCIHALSTLLHYLVALDEGADPVKLGLSKNKEHAYMQCVDPGEPYTVYLGHKRIFDYIEDTCRTFANVVDNFRPGEVYNVGGREEWEHEIKLLRFSFLTLLLSVSKPITLRLLENA